MNSGVMESSISVQALRDQLDLEIFASNLTNADELHWVDPSSSDNRRLSLRASYPGAKYSYQF